MCMKFTPKPSAICREALLLTREAHGACKECCTCSASMTADLKLQPGTVLSAWPKIRRLAREHISGNHVPGHRGISECTAASASDVRMTAAVVISRNLPNAHVQIQPDIDEPVLT